jgi:predicted ATP-grasp superfamily ATP-dependent carboligase
MDLVRPLGIAGITCVAAGPTQMETRWSRYTRGSVELPDLWTEPEKTVERLISFARRQEMKPVLFYQKDPAVLTISRHRRELGKFFDFVVPEAELVEDLVDKDRFQERADSLGLPIPAGAVITAGSSMALPDELVFPVIVKPVLRSRPLETWRPVAGGAKAVLCETAQELTVLLNRSEVRGERFSVQRYIPGDETSIVSYHAFIDDDGNLVGDFCGRKIRTLPREFGQSTAVEIVELPEVRAEGLEVLRAFGFTGVAKVDFKQAKDGELFLLEVNPRFSLWNHPAAVAGVNVPAAVYQYLTSARPVAPLPRAREGVGWVQVWGDRRAARNAGVPMSEWVRFVVASDARRAFHLTDPGSIIGAITFGVLQKLGLAPRS